jgi:hypothetical protein
MQYEIFCNDDIGYRSMMHYNDWRVAILNYIDDCSIDDVRYFEAHQNTDEVFVLLQGEVTLLFADINENQITNYTTVKLEKQKIYNVKKGVYHTQIMSKDAKLLIVEDKDTGDDNSVKYYINKEDRDYMRTLI